MNTKTQDPLNKTGLYNLHGELGAKMVPFSGYHMPVQYPNGIIAEHLHTRDQAGLFDVSHMGQLVISGDGVAQALEKLIPVDLASLAQNQQAYAVLTNPLGGIMDDLIITRWSEDCFFLVVNAGCKKNDIAYFKKHLNDFEIDHLENQSLIALQGPAAKTVIKKLAPAANSLVFMTGCQTQIEGIDCFITRSGYTGEDGFEISLPEQCVESLARRLLSFDEVAPVGLGARDSLRLEAGLCLYGHDLTHETTPVQASLLWSISRSRRINGDNPGGFPGDEVILREIENGVTRKRVGFVVDGRVPVREGATLLDKKGCTVGMVTSGCYSPTLSVPVAMGFVEHEYATVGSELFAPVRGKKVAVTVAKMPFVERRYFRG
jgi:glycine cleavage system T protein (aminomethyltransferase)